jgi:hypothetical protein
MHIDTVSLTAGNRRLTIVAKRNIDNATADIPSGRGIKLQMRGTLYPRGTVVEEVH